MEEFCTVFFSSNLRKKKGSVWWSAKSVHIYYVGFWSITFNFMLKWVFLQSSFIWHVFLAFFSFTHAQSFILCIWSNGRNQTMNTTTNMYSKLHKGFVLLQTSSIYDFFFYCNRITFGVAPYRSINYRHWLFINICWFICQQIGFNNRLISLPRFISWHFPARCWVNIHIFLWNILYLSEFKYVFFCKWSKSSIQSKFSGQISSKRNQYSDLRFWQYRNTLNHIKLKHTHTYRERGREKFWLMCVMLWFPSFGLCGPIIVLYT